MEQTALTPPGDFIEGSEILSDAAVIPPEEWAQICYSAARIDGAGDLIIFSRILLPISVPELAAVSLFEIVGRWNQFTAPLLYLTDETKYSTRCNLPFSEWWRLMRVFQEPIWCCRTPAWRQWSSASVFWC